MRVLLLLALCFAVLNAAVLKSKIRNAGSLRRRLIKVGALRKFLDLHAKYKNDHTQPVMDFFDDFYLANISVGTPPQTFTIVPDTGSSNLWLIDATCRSEACKGYPQSGYKKHQYDTRKSSTFIKDGQYFSIQYGSGSCSGYLADDVLDFAGLEIKKQKFGVATTLAEVFGYQPVDGIMGLGWPAIAVDNVVPPMQNLLDQLDEPVFTVWMDRKTGISEGGVGGLITYGGFDRTNCEDNVKWVSLSSLTYWQFPMNGFKIGKYGEHRRHQVISDTGTSWIGGPGSYISAIAKEVGATFDYYNQLYVVDCSKQKTAPSLVLNIGEEQYSIPPIEYILDLGLGDGKCVMTFFDMNGGGFGPAWILGDTFIRTFCNVHDIGKQRIGFALAKHSF